MIDVEFFRLINISIQIGNFNPKIFCQIDDFTMHSWHLNRIHFIESQ
jgi:hypothetical protein